DVVQGLLHCERDARGLRVEAQLECALAPRAEALAHHARPDASRGAVLRNLLEKVVVRVEEERDARDELVNVQTRVYAPLDVLDAVAQCEGEFLQRGRARLAYVVAAHGN